MHKRPAIILLLAVLISTVPAQAHHSDAMFNRELELELTATIKEFQFTNPHTWIQATVVNDKGETVEWSLEWGSPNQLGRQGVRPSSFPVGSQVQVRFNPMRDGSAAGAFIGAKLADGTMIGRWQ